MRLLSSIIYVTTGGTDFDCPNGHGLDVGEWNTEYGDAVQGTHEVECPKCGEIFKVYCEVVVRLRT
jgi:hypothetical protein